MKTTLILAAILPSLFLASCATIINNEAIPVQISSSPEGAKIEVYKTDGTRIDHGITPMTVDLARDYGYFKRPRYRVVMEHPGYSHTEVTVAGRPNWSWYVGGNFLIGGVIGWAIVDPATGAMWNFDPVNTVLMPTGAVQEAAAPTNVPPHSVTGAPHVVEHALTNAPPTNASLAEKSWETNAPAAPSP